MYGGQIFEVLALKELRVARSEAESLKPASNELAEMPSLVASAISRLTTFAGDSWFVAGFKNDSCKITNQHSFRLKLNKTMQGAS